MTTNRSLERIIDDQMRTWALGNKAKSQAVWRPLITISRSFGAQGAALARVLGERTGYTVWDRDLVHAVAKEGGGDERILATVDEHRRSQIDEALRGLIVGFSNSNVKYFRSLIRVIRTISLHGSAIIVGRGANFALPVDQALRVRATAPLDWRIARISSSADLSTEEARSEVVTRDAERADFVSYHFRQQIQDAEHYDLVLDASRFTLEEMADLVLKAYGFAFPKVAAGPSRERAESLA